MEPTTIIVALMVSVIAPTIVAVITASQARRSKQQDWARQDLVADRAAAEAKALIASQELRGQRVAAELFAAQTDLINRTDEVARLAKLATASTNSQLRQIHTLVNSDMTAARQSELDQTRITLVMLRKVVALVEAAGREPSDDDRAAIATTEARIDELQAILADRLHQQRQVEAEQAAAAAE